MASIKERKKKDGSIVYEVSVTMYRKTGDGKKERIRKFTTFTPDPRKGKRENQKALDQFVLDYEKKVRDGSILSEEVTLKQYTETWLRVYVDPNRETLTAANYRRLIAMVNEEIGHLYLSKLTATAIQECMNNLRKKKYTRNGKTYSYSDRTIRDCKTALSALCSCAVEDGLLSVNPCYQKTKRGKKKVSPKTLHCFTLQQAMTFLDAIDNKPLKKMSPAHTVQRNGKTVQIREYCLGEWRVPLRYCAAFQLAIFLGLRREELNGLEWRDVDLENWIVRIERAAIYYNGHFEIKPPKSEAGYRSIFVPQCVIDVLHKLKNETLQSIMRLGTAWEGSRKIENVPVFCNDTGSRLVPTDFNHALKRAITAINYDIESESDKLPLISMHKLRHTSASILIAQGLDYVSVAARLGHSDPSTTLKIYAHAFEEKDRQAAEAIERALVSGLEELKAKKAKEDGSDKSKIVNF